MLCFTKSTVLRNGRKLLSSLHLRCNGAADAVVGHLHIWGKSESTLIAFGSRLYYILGTFKF